MADSDRLDLLERRVQALEQEVAGERDVTRHVFGKLAGIERTLSEHGATLREHSATLREHSATLREHGAALRRVEKKIDDLAAAMPGIVASALRDTGKPS